MLLCVFLFDDATLRRLLPVRLTSWIEVRAPRPGRLATAVAAGLALIVMPVGLNRIWQPLTGMGLPLASTFTEAISPLLVVNPYGLFVTTTTARSEIIIEGSDDGQIWREYVFRYKPGPVTRAPTWNIPHQPRLDWQLWFAAYRSVAENAWFERLIHELLKGSPAVLALVAANPFPDRPPKYVRALLYDYRFADTDSYARTEQWWVRRLEGLYLPQVTLADFPRAVRAVPRNVPRRECAALGLAEFDPITYIHLCLLVVRGTDEQLNRMAGVSRPAKTFTPKQGQYLAFIYAYTRLHRRPPAEADMQQYFRVSPPSVHQMVLTLERAGFIQRQPGVARSIEMLVDPEHLPVLLPVLR